MKGLLLKDLFNLRRIMKQYFFVAALMFVWSVFLKNQMLFTMIMIMYSMMMLLTTMSFDESSQFNKYALTMPVTRRELAGEKYILMLLLMLAGVAVGFVGGGILSLFSSEEISWLSAEKLVSIAAVSGVYVLGFSVLLPMIFKYGVEKSRLLLAIIYLLVFGVLYGTVSFIRQKGLVISENQIVVFAVLCIVFCFAVFAVSWFVSVRIMEKKEW